MKTIDIRQKLHQYIETAEVKKVKAIFAMVEDEIAETSDHWKSEKFVAALEKRETTYLNRTSKTFTIDQAVCKAKSGIKKAKHQ